MNTEFFTKMMTLLEFDKYDDLRDLFSSIHHWGNNTDFTARDFICDDPKLYFKAFIISRFYDTEYPICYLSDISENILGIYDKSDVKKIHNIFKELDL